MTVDDVLEFWFQQCRPWQWFRRRDSFDALERERFGDLRDIIVPGWRDDKKTKMKMKKEKKSKEAGN